MEFKTLLISDKKVLSSYEGAILKLFKSSFSKELPSSVWEWAYINNPNGNPIVSLYFDEEKLIGHYAIIPVKLRLNDCSKSILAGLSMTTMVDSKYRKYGVFVKQANDVFSEAKRLGYDLIYGFPNKNSAPGFMKRLGWTLDKSYQITSFQQKAIPSEMSVKHSKSLIEFDLIDRNQKHWRLSKPDQKYLVNDGLVVKPFEDGVDILYVNEDCNILVEYEKFNILTNIDVYKKIDFEQNPYIFGYKILNEDFMESKFKVELIMSDVF